MEFMDSQLRFSSAPLRALAERLRPEYTNADPFPHIVVDDF